MPRARAPWGTLAAIALAAAAAVACQAIIGLEDVPPVQDASVDGPPGRVCVFDSDASLIGVCNFQ